jgi:hypothetical protein
MQTEHYIKSEHIAKVIRDIGLRSPSGIGDDEVKKLRRLNKSDIINALINYKPKKKYSGLTGFIMNLLGCNPEVM